MSRLRQLSPASHRQDCQGDLQKIYQGSKVLYLLCNWCHKEISAQSPEAFQTSQPGRQKSRAGSRERKPSQMTVLFPEESDNQAYDNQFLKMDKAFESNYISESPSLFSDNPEEHQF